MMPKKAQHFGKTALYIIIIKKHYELLNELDTAKPEEQDVVEKLIEDYKTRVDNMLNADYYGDVSDMDMS